MTGTEIIEAAAKRRHSMWDTERLAALAAKRELHHIDGPLIAALADLAMSGRAEFMGSVVYRAGRFFRIAGHCYASPDPVDVLTEAESLVEEVAA